MNECTFVMALEEEQKGKRPAETSGETTRVIQTLDRGLILLEALSEERRDVSLSELASRFAWDKSTTFRLLATLIRRGYVEQDVETSKYRLGLNILTLSSALNRRLDLKQRAHPLIEELALKTRETCHVAALDRGEVVILDQRESPEKIQANAYVGMREPAHCTALGKVLLADLVDAELDQWFEKRDFPRFTWKTITDPALLREHLVDVRQQEYAFDDEEYDTGMRCLSCPVLNGEGRVSAALGISGPAHRIRFEQLDHYLELVKDTADKISARMGYRGNGSEG